MLTLTQIINGELVYNETTQNANGGTELMARRMVRDIPQDLLKGKQIVFSRIRDLDPNLKKIFYAHDLANDPEVKQLADSTFRSQFEKIVFVSNWQQHTYNMVLGVPFDQSHVIRNAIELPDKLQERDYTGQIRLIYHTTPHRGLSILYPIFIELSKHFDVHLDVFSSFKAYGWEERDVQYQQLFDKLNELENVTMHGFQPNSVIREYLAKSHIFAYPSIWTETSCLALIEAMVFGNFCVHSNLGALPETSVGCTNQYMFNENINKHAQTFYNHLYLAIKWIQNNPQLAIDASYRIANHTSGYYNWDMVSLDWKKLLSEVQ